MTNYTGKVFDEVGDYSHDRFKLQDRLTDNEKLLQHLSAKYRIIQREEKRLQEEKLEISESIVTLKRKMIKEKK